MVSNIKVYYTRKTSNLLNLFDYLFLENQMFILLFWPAYYFNKLGYGYTSSLIVSAFPICVVLGTLICQPLIDKFPTRTNIITVILIALNFLSFFGMAFLGSDQSEIPIYMVLLGFGSFVWIVPYLRTFSIDVSQRIENPREKYLVSNFMRTARELLTGVSLFLIGLLMEQSNYE